MGHEADRISDQDFRRLTDLIGSEFGIALPAGKRIMLETRLAKRVRALGIKSFSDYCRFVCSPEGKREEWPKFVDCVTTHKTDFFREPAHFEFLIDQVLPELAASGAGIRRPLVVWSAACSTGEEPYTLAMVLARYRESIAPEMFQFRILGSDISEAVLETARLAVYPEAAAQPLPEELRRRYMLRSKDRNRALLRITPEIRATVRFEQINLAEARYGLVEPFDVVLCRNVMIYFDRAGQQKVLGRISLALRRGGYLMMGHSESLHGLELPLVQVAPTVYRRVDE